MQFRLQKVQFVFKFVFVSKCIVRVESLMCRMPNFCRTDSILLKSALSSPLYDDRSRLLFIMNDWLQEIRHIRWLTGCYTVQNNGCVTLRVISVIANFKSHRNRNWLWDILRSGAIVDVKVKRNFKLNRVRYG